MRTQETQNGGEDREVNVSNSPAACRAVCVFCGSNAGTASVYVEAARRLGALLAAEKFDLVYGGSTDGCMGALADAALAGGGQVIGIAPSFLGSVEHRHKGLTRFEPVEDLAARKLRMLSLSAGVIVLPGGTGTLDEFLEVLTMKRLAVVSHPLIIVDVADFFRPLRALLQHIIDTGFAAAAQRSLYEVVEDPISAVRVLKATLAAAQRDR